MTTAPAILEPFGPDFLTPAQEACPHCPCCSEALCRKGRASVLECAGCTHADLRATVSRCPCSAATTEGTAAWRAGMVTATLQAAELPLPDPLEAVLRALDSGETDVHDPHGFLHALRLRQFVQTRPDFQALTVTSLGRAYLAARDGQRTTVRARVDSVDPEENTARVLLDVCRPDQAVTVLADQLVHATSLEPYELPGLELDVTANADAERAQDIVLTGIRSRPTPMPEPWRAETDQAPDTDQAPEGETDSAD
ncbi:hypothetical protein WB388_40550 [Streptomyces brasiliscabiei]|uniref:Uncharacterized protein n=1 Tax=Streptomyces brasiliscabiei TaxID=2736302 RepID=A0ABU8GJV7_9ACTN